jgi:hypothetical protein
MTGEDVKVALGTVWDITWVWALIAVAAALCLYGGRVWRGLRQRARHLPRHLPRPKRQAVRPDLWHDLPPLPKKDAA